MNRRKKQRTPAIAEVAIPGVPKILHYTIPEGLADTAVPGVFVSVSLGSRTTGGYLVNRTVKSDIRNLKPLMHVPESEPWLSPEMLRLTRWISDYYLVPWGSVIRAALPSAIGKIRGKSETLYRLGMTCEWVQEHLPEIRKIAPAQAGILREFIKGDPLQRSSAILRKTGASAGVIRRMVEKGLLVREIRRVIRDPFHGEEIQKDVPPSLSPEQADAVTALQQAVESGRFETFLLHGVTGSGKTEVYLHAIAGALARGREAILIVPEIALTPQLVSMVRARFDEPVAVLHSGLSAGERFDQWDRIRRGEAAIAVGARSAIFAPFTHLGVIVVDEEHDPTYKQEETPRYHARDLAVVRGRLAGVPVILGSATPSVESYAHARNGKYRLLTLPKRIHDRPMPEVRLIDMKKENGAPALSKRLEKAVRSGLRRNEQILLFLNRRGYAPFLLCTTCCFVLRCPDCSVSLTYHLKEDRLLCHHCGHTASRQTTCPECGAEALTVQGRGTERLEEEVKKKFNDSTLFRLDRDTAQRKGAARRILERFRSREGEILIGTQMVTKGHHLPGISTVGVLNADASLHLPDFRSGERTFQLLIQVAGRAGRGDVPGKVYLQCYTPEHYAIEAAVRHDYRRFFEQEIRFRKELDYPPYCRMVQLILAARSLEKAENAAKGLGEILRKQVARRRETELLGPVRAPLATLRGKRRFQILLKGKGVRELHETVRQAVSRFSQTRGRSGVDLVVDVDPVNFL